MAETGLVSLPSLLTAVLLQANNRSSSDQALVILPSYLEEVATGVLKVLNNMACLDITLLQCMRSRSDRKMELFHLISFLSSHCMNEWRVPNDQVGLLLLESILLVGYFSMFHAGNQAVIQWGKSPTILHKVYDLPSVFFNDPELMPILVAALTAVCDQNRSVVLQEINWSFLRSCRASRLATADGSEANNSGDDTQISLDARNSLPDISIRSGRKAVFGKGVSGDVRLNISNRTSDDVAPKQRAGEALSAFMLHRKIPAFFLDRAEEFFCSGGA